MSAAPILGVREAVITHLKADLTVTAVLPAASIYGERQPAGADWPFSRYGVSDSRPGDISFPIHVFSKESFTDEVAIIVERIGNSLHGLVITLDDGRRVRLICSGTRIDPDGAEADAWHGTVRVAATIARDCDDPLS